MGFNVVICSTDNSLDKEERYISLLKQKASMASLSQQGFAMMLY